ncbi:tyrosine-type recombinase/integrase [Salinactinospora qingdaonensis]|uniref:Site-specific integrase n=1 Tax=Salinactinospora qingdaonensis TaxID=702744 RepID=A0ABP7ETI5_9ACTN
MPGKKNRSFGNVRQLASGRFQARYRGPDGRLRGAPTTFDTKKAAERWLTLKEAEIAQGDWFDPDAGKALFSDYARQWIDDRVLKPRTEELYLGLLRRHLAPTFGEYALADITQADVRRWRKALLTSGVGSVTVAKAYRLLRAIMNTALREKRVRENPCQIEGAGKEDSPEREVVSVAKVVELVTLMHDRYRALVLLATFAGLRWGELVGLRRCDVDLDACTVRVHRPTGQLDNGRLSEDDPKSRAGRRLVAFPVEIVPRLRWHMDTYAQAGPNGRVFIGPKGGRPRRGNFHRIWKRTREKAGVPELHLHDLRHTGNTMAAATGASLRELMARMGHSSTRAAMIYQHATPDRDRAIAAALGRSLGSVSGLGGAPTAEKKDGQSAD